MRTRHEVYCCLGCGRDTRRPGGYCIDCGGRPGERSSRARCRNHPNGSKERNDPMDLEDRYDDESGPDDVCDDSGFYGWCDKVGREKLRHGT